MYYSSLQSVGAKMLIIFLTFTATFPLPVFATEDFPSPPGKWSAPKEIPINVEKVGPPEPRDKTEKVVSPDLLVKLKKGPGQKVP